MKYETVIGLEVHVQLNTESKIFSSASNKFGADANSHVTPLCMGMPGTLPVLNKEVVNSAIKAGLALNCNIRKINVFARKNYFYPDLPKGYQISQFDKPICEGGYIDIQLEDGTEKRLNLTRIHMEEDAGKLIHGESIGSAAHSYVDLNRTGTPLLEIVSEPEMRSAEEARAYLQKLKSILLYTGVSDCNMEEGSLRCDANVSIRPFGQEEFGTRAEIKNLNSFRNVQKAIEYEVKRQIQEIEFGGKIVQETRLWNVAKGVTESMRGKEHAHDYRYFPDPDLVPVVISDKQIDDIKATLPEMPDARKARFVEQYGLPAYDAEVLTSLKEYAEFFEDAVKFHDNAKGISNWIMSELLSVVNEKLCGIYEAGMSAENLAGIVKLIDSGKISGKIAKDLFKEVLTSGKAPEVIVEEKGMVQVSDEGEIEKAVQEVIDANPAEAERYRNGEKKLQGFFVGQIMKATKGKANPKVVNEFLGKLLG